MRQSAGRLDSVGDLTPLAAPAAVGTGVQGAQELGILQSGHIEHDIVFAYRLREILYKRKVLNDQREYRKGDLFAKNRESREEAVAAPQEYEYNAEVLKLQEENPDLPELWDMDADVARDAEGAEVRDPEGDVVVCVRVTKDDEDL
ncbi:hypothetical protein C8A03DRAFT_39098 [Achaetomium macrosporum]|uniref:Uncharacterized protein n=1 Tax=Achaetomium macrosporum TaxID=79813 RepID=A0AAN7C0S7_9PEZI|nr:hypothetical protein C8A03DRAFT_39098 [Achaetomium macrosporum]